MTHDPISALVAFVDAIEDPTNGITQDTLILLGHDVTTQDAAVRLCLVRRRIVHRGVGKYTFPVATIYPAGGPRRRS